MESLTHLEVVITSLGTALSFATSVWLLLTLRRHVDHDPADPEGVARLVRSAPREFLRNVLNRD